MLFRSQLYLLRREINGLQGSRIAASFARVIVASAVMGGACWGVHQSLLGAMPGDGLPIQMVRLLVTIVVSLATLAAAAQLLRIREFGEARDLVLGRLRRMSG